MKAIKACICHWVLLAGLAISPLEAFAWGSDGHKTIGAIADQLLQGTPTEAKVKALLKPGETLSSASVWADCAKGQQAQLCAFPANGKRLHPARTTRRRCHHLPLGRLCRPQILWPTWQC